MNYIIDDVLPNSKNGSILMDNARIHHYKKFKQSLRDKGLENKIIYNVPYHPQYNPIEYVFNVIKKKINSSDICSYKELVHCLDTEFQRLNGIGFNTYFDHSLKVLKISTI
ncbi:MAG: transposase [Hyperionvirus sp.]|uniref:Transposase n=1 Tax=Hyperionvirus sp. TaxID=2487770 RepID=A0A3G5AF55_9VIRU|nr:MAG: transposase [Hyperionvirus sp.]